VTAPLRYCSTPGCPATVPCPTHARPPRGWTGENPARIRGRRLQRLRQALFAAEPWCRLCWSRGIRTIATVRDHVRPLAEGGDDDPMNIQPICADCSRAKTHAESQRGRRRR
jgi:5-methylcytosine-specific restriction protein A